MNTTHLNDDGLKFLQAAILKQAVHDYKVELRVGGGANLEKWFLSEWGQMLSRGYGADIIERCKREIATGYNDKKGVDYD